MKGVCKKKKRFVYFSKQRVVAFCYAYSYAESKNKIHTFSANAPVFSNIRMSIERACVRACVRA